jgi:hypothetical protein
MFSMRRAKRSFGSIQASNFSLKPKQLTEAQKLIEEHLNDRSAWTEHFPSGSH